MYISKIQSELPVDVQLIYELSQDLKSKPQFVKDVQELSLNDNSTFGLKRDKGLFNSDEWWNNIENGIIPSVYRIGVIVNLYKAGQDNLNQNNAFKFKTNDHITYDESIYLIKKEDYEFFKTGHLVVAFYALNELKVSTPKKPDYSHRLIEMAVSKEPLSLAQNQLSQQLSSIID